MWLCITNSSQSPSLRRSLATLCTKTCNILWNPEDKTFLSSVWEGGWVSGVAGGRETDRKGQKILPLIIPILFETTKQQENKEHLQIH